MAKLYNLARMTTATTGTGTITLGAAVVGALSFSSAGVSDGENITYAIQDGSNSEIGRGVYTASGTTLTRSVLKSTNSNTAISLSGSAEVFITPAAEDLLDASPPGGRLTLTTATPRLTSTVSAATTIYYSPYVSRFVPLYNGTSFDMYDIGGELKNATANTTTDSGGAGTGGGGPAACATNSNYDLFVWSNAGTYTLTRGPAWTSSTARGTGAGTTELERVKGVLLNKVAITNGPAANRGTYVGTVRSNGTSTIDFIFGGAAAGGTAAFFGVWNMYNRVNFGTFVADTTDFWTTSNTTIHAANEGGTGSGLNNRASFISGWQEDAYGASFTIALATGRSTSGNAFCGIGLDSTSTFTGVMGACGFGAGVAGQGTGFATGSALGFHYLQAVEVVQAGTGTATYYGDAGLTSLQSGLMFSFRM